MTVHVHDQVAAWVDGEPLPVAEVDTQVSRLRGGAFGVRLPAADTAEGRNSRRWVVQLLCARRIVHAEAAARGLDDAGTDAVQLRTALTLGGVTAAALASGGRPVMAAVTEHVTVDEQEIRSYYERNSDLFGDGMTPFTEARAAIAADLVEQARLRTFATWLDRQFALRVRLADGFNHPAEPGRPDATHRH